MRASCRPVVRLLALLAVAASPYWVEAREKVQAEDVPIAPPAEEPHAPAAEPVRDLGASPAEVRTALLTLLQEEAFPLAKDGSETEIVTEFTPFAANRFGHNVAMPPPKVSPTFPYYQMNRMVTGKARLRVTIEAREKGSRVRIDASLLSPAVNRMTYESTEIPRQSNGAIEQYFLDRLEARLTPGKPQTAPSN